MKQNQAIRDVWFNMLSDGESSHRRMYHIFGMLPSEPRCKLCNAPFRGIGKFIIRLMGKRQSKQNPYFCNPCMASAPVGGAEVELTMLFADVRGSTTLAERMSVSQFSELMKRFYKVATGVLVKSDALIDKVVGDEVIGLYVPGYAGPRHARQAIHGAQELLRVTGHDDSDAPWLPIGIGVHTGVAYVGTVGGSDGILTDITALGDNVNITARLASKAGAGEILISDSTFTAAGMNLGNLEQRRLDLKGKSEQVSVRVLRI